MVERAEVIRYETTCEHTIDRLELSVEIDDEQDISFLEGRNGTNDINDRDPETRGGVRSDAIMRARHGKDWGLVGVIVRSQPDNAVRASLWGIDVHDSEVYRHNAKARERADAYFGELLSDLLGEARDQVHDEHYPAGVGPNDERIVDRLPVVDVNNAPVDGASLRFAASSTIDWWVQP